MDGHIIITDAQLLRESGDVCIDSTDIGMSDHFLVWLKLGRTAKNSRKQKRTIRRRRSRAIDSKISISLSVSMKALKCKTLGGIHALSHIEQQVPRTIYCACTYECLAAPCI